MDFMMMCSALLILATASFVVRDERKTGGNLALVVSNTTPAPFNTAQRIRTKIRWAKSRLAWFCCNGMTREEAEWEVLIQAAKMEEVDWLAEEQRQQEQQQQLHLNAAIQSSLPAHQLHEAALAGVTLADAAAA